jgi:putative ABC transport system permease protein
MQIRNLAWASLKRRKGRFGFMLGAIALAIGTVVALLALSEAMEADVADELDRFGANIVITPRSRMVDLAYGSVAVAGLTVDAQALKAEDAGLVRTIPHKRNIAVVAPKLIGTTTLEGDPVLAIGIDPREELGIKLWWTIEGAMPRSDDEVLLGAELARRYRKPAGSTLRLGDVERRVSGVLHPTGTLDDEAVFATLPVVQAALGQPGAVSIIEVAALCRGCPVEDIVAQIAEVLPHARVAPIRQAVAARERAVRQFAQFSWIVAAVVLLVAVLVVLSTMTSSVVERTQEIGILRAVGFRQTHVGRLVMMEALAVSAAGGLAGWALGTAAAAFAATALVQLSVPVSPDWRVAAAALAAAAVLGVAGGVTPALRAARLEPGRALRHY